MCVDNPKVRYLTELYQQLAILTDPEEIQSVTIELEHRFKEFQQSENASTEDLEILVQACNNSIVCIEGQILLKNRELCHTKKLKNAIKTYKYI